MISDGSYRRVGCRQKHTNVIIVTVVKRIAFYHPSFPGGGAERITLDIIRYLERFKDGYELHVITQRLNDAYMTDYITRNVKIVFLPGFSSTETEMKFALSDIFSEYQFDVFVQVGGGNLPGLRMLADNNGCKVIFANHSGPTLDMEQIIRTKKDRAKGSILRSMKWYLSGWWRYVVFGKAKRQGTKLCRSQYNVSDCYTVLCDEYKRIFEKNFHLGPDNRIVVMNNPEYEVKDVSYCKDKIILFVGRLSAFDKRVDRLLRVWKRIQDKAPDYELKIVGDGVERDNLENLAARLKLHRISFEGYQTNVAMYYKKASILCLTSTTEGWPLCLTEAQANGVIPVAFGCSGGVREILSPSGVNGFIVRPFSEGRYARTLLKIIRLPEEKKMDIRRNAVNKSKTYSAVKVCAKWKRLFDTI